MRRFRGRFYAKFSKRCKFSPAKISNMKKFKEYSAEPIILHTGELKEKDGVLYLPLYMTMLL